MFEPVHAYPPHAIRSDGVGPYRLGMDMKDVLRDLPEGPHNELLQIGRYANWRIVRSEDANLIVGADSKGQVVFVSVLGADVARTESGVGVGATGAELVAALGPPDDAVDVVRDRRIVEAATLPSVRFVAEARVEVPADQARVIAVLVERPGKTAPPPRAPSLCRTGGPLASQRAETLQVARGKGAAPAEAGQAVIRFGCISAAAPEAIVVAGDDLALVAGEPGKLRRLGTASAPGVDLVGALDIDGDGKDEIVWAAQRRSDVELTLEVHVLRWEAGKLVEALSQKPIVIAVDAAAAAGVTPAQIDLAIEIRAERGALAVGGIYMTRFAGRLRELAPLQTMSLKLDLKRQSGAAGADLPASVDAPPSGANGNGKGNGDAR